MSDRELLIRLDVKMDACIGRLDDHGKRIRALETVRNMAAGASVIVAAVLGWFKVKASIE